MSQNGANEMAKKGKLSGDPHTFYQGLKSGIRLKIQSRHIVLWRLCDQQNVNGLPEGKSGVCHGIDDGKRLQVNAAFTDQLSSLLKSFFDHDSSSFDGCAGFMDQIQKSHQSTSVGQEIINYKHMVLRTQKFFGENYIINFLWVKDSTLV